MDTPTVDEFAHLPAGLAYWSHGAWSLYSKNPPLIKLWMTIPLELGAAGPLNVPEVKVSPFGWGPWLYGSEFERLNASLYLRIFFIARFMIVLLAAATGVLIYLWARTFCDELAAATASFAFWLAPTVLAHAHLATVDIGATFLILLFCFLLARASLSPTWHQSVVIGAALGAALLAKFTTLFLLPWFALWLVQRARGSRLKTFAVSTATSILVVNLAFGFTHTWQSVGDYHFTSELMTRVSSWLPAALPIPLPRDFSLGFDAQMGDAELGEFSNYLFGQWSRKGWWYYNIVALTLKENPLSIIFLFFSPLAALTLRSRERWSILAPLVAMGIPLTFFNPLQVGVRYLLPLFPLFFLLFAQLIVVAGRKWGLRATSALAIASCWIWLGCAVVVVPAYLSYFSPIASLFGEKADLLLDSNLDWGQDLYRVKQIAETLGVGVSGIESETIGLMYFGHVPPSLYGIRFQLIPDTPVRGLLVVSANLLQGMAYMVPSPDANWVQIPEGHLNWLKKFKPVRVEGSLYIFDTRTGAL